MPAKNAKPTIEAEFENGAVVLSYDGLPKSKRARINEFTGAAVWVEKGGSPKDRARFTMSAIEVTPHSVSLILQPSEGLSVTVGQLRELADALRRLFGVPAAEVAIMPVDPEDGETPDFDA